MLPVQLHSTSLHAATFHEQHGDLELQFASGAIYRYRDVPAPVYEDLLRAKSKGRYFNQHIRNRFRYAKIAGNANFRSSLPTSTE